MLDNYDNICSICGKLVDEGTLYYCCPVCHRINREKHKDVNEPDSLVENQKEGEVSNG